jgi:hypothetical protein
MPRAVVTEFALLQTINEAIAREWKYPGRTCLVEKLKPTNNPEGNWVVDATSTSGPDLTHANECELLRKQVVSTLARSYEVAWPEEA